MIKRIFTITLTIFILACILVWFVFLKGNINSTESPYFYIKTGSSKLDVNSLLKEKSILKNQFSFELASKLLKYKTVKAGKYSLKNVKSNLDLIKLLRSGNQEPVKFTFQKFRTIEQFCGYTSQKLEIDSVSFLNFVTNIDSIKQFGFTPNDVIGLFIPNTYEFWWNTNFKEFLNRMLKESDKFWNNPEIQKKLEIQKLTQNEVLTIASIVEEETNKNDEKETIAGVYINRFRKGMKLEADPTVKFAVGDFSIKRIVRIHLQKDSPYNTYMYAGLPPGPICTPSIASINSVLNYKSHNYLYFCAKEDFSGYHNFAKDFATHLQNARMYQQALNNSKIF